MMSLPNTLRNDYILCCQVLQHSNIVRLLGVIREEGGASLSERLFMVMEYLHMGSLKTYLQQTPSIEDITLLDFALDVASVCRHSYTIMTHIFLIINYHLYPGYSSAVMSQKS